MDSKRPFKTNTVFNLPTVTDGPAFASLLRGRQVAVSEDGTTFFHVGRAANSDHERLLSIVGSGFDLPLPLSDIRLLKVEADEVIFWGQSAQPDASGIYRIMGAQATLLERLHEFHSVIETPGGPLVKGRNAGDTPGQARYILPSGRGFVLISNRAQVTVGLDGTIATMDYDGRRWRHRLWHRDGRERELRTFKRAHRVLVVPWQNSHAYLLDRGDHFRFVAPGLEHPWTFHGHIECLWNSPSQRHVFFLSRDSMSADGVASRRLFLDGEPVEDAIGAFTMERDDLCWSADDSQFVAKLSAKRDRLITSRGEVYDAPPGQRVSQMAVDNYGQISFFVLTSGVSQIPHIYGQPTPTAALVWNLQNQGRQLGGNLLDPDGYRVKRFAFAT